MQFQINFFLYKNKHRNSDSILEIRDLIMNYNNNIVAKKCKVSIEVFAY